jgi:flavin-dependent dehydrogenase
MQDDADVLVVGAGPAGATAARVLALDKARFPRNKPCGGGVTTRALDRFPYLRALIRTLSPRLFSRLHLEGPRRKAFVYGRPRAGSGLLPGDQRL